MTDTTMVEAIRAVGAGGAQYAVSDPAAANAVLPAADPDSVARFQAAMGAGVVQKPDPIPFASEASAAWRSARVNNQGILHRIRALSKLDRRGATTAEELVELQYEVMNLAFQQEIVTKVADKSSTAIQTLVKNQ